MPLQRRSQIRHSQSVSAAESVLSGVRFLIRSRGRVPLLVLKASFQDLSLSLSLPLSFISVSFDFSSPYTLAAHLACVARARTKSPLVEYRLSIFIAVRSACVAYISDISSIKRQDVRFSEPIGHRRVHRRLIGR